LKAVSWVVKKAGHSDDTKAA